MFHIFTLRGDYLYRIAYLCLISSTLGARAFHRGGDGDKLSPI